MADPRRPDRSDRVVERAARLVKPRLATEIRGRARYFRTVAAASIKENPRASDQEVAEYLVALAELFLAPLLPKAQPKEALPRGHASFEVRVRLLVTAVGGAPTATEVAVALESGLRSQTGKWFGGVRLLGANALSVEEDGP